MAPGYCLILCCLLAGCATQHRPDYNVAVTNLVPDCANRDAQIRYLDKLKRFPTTDNERLYNKTIDIQIERLLWYCR